MMTLEQSLSTRAVIRCGILVASLLLAVAFLSSCSTGYTQIKSTPEEDHYYEEPYEPDYPTGFPALDPYGRWVYVQNIGWAWQPDVFRDWRPYYHGHWVWSDYGWTWLSYEPFGWAVYHYGHWVLDPYWGWIWLPGYDWHPHRYPYHGIRTAIRDTGIEMWTGAGYAEGLRAGSLEKADRFGFQGVLSTRDAWEAI